MIYYMDFLSVKTWLMIVCDTGIYGIKDIPLFLLHIDSTVPGNIAPLTVSCGCTAWFVSDRVENSKDRISHDAAQMIKQLLMS